MTLFVGDDRHEAVDGLVDAYDRVAAGTGPELVCLVAPIGWGKTRIVQEFYARLAAERQTDPPYWPARIVDATDITEPTKLRKRVHPGRFDVAGGAAPAWFWWALSCQRKADGERAQAIEDSKEQLFAHAEAIEQCLTKAQRVRLGLSADQIRGKASALAGLLGVFVPPVGWAATVHDSLSQLYATGKAFSESRRKQARLKADREVDVVRADRSALVEELAGSLARLTGEPAPMPTVLVVDDAHDAAESTVALISRLLASPTARVLVLATAWPDQLAVQAGEHDGFGAWLAGFNSAPFTRIDLDRLGGTDLAELVRLAAPATPEIVIAGLLARAEGNPFVLGLILSLPVVRRSIKDGAITLSPDQISGVSGEIRRLYLEKWNDLPEPVREALAVASVQGSEFVEDLARQAALGIGFDEAAEWMPQATDPYAWVRSVDSFLAEFVEPAQFDVTATAANDGILTRDDRDRIRRALVDYVATKRNDDSWNELSSEAQLRLLRHHVILAHEGLATDLTAAGRSAMALARFAAGSRHYREAVRHGQVAVGWLTEAQGPFDPDTLLTRSQTAFWMAESGRVDEAIAEFETVLEDRSRVLGSDHPDTLMSRHDLACWRGESGQVREAVALLEDLEADQIRVLGPDHPDTMITRRDVAIWLRASGRLDEASKRMEELSIVRLRVLGPDHPDTLATRQDAAFLRGDVGRVDEAVERLERLLADRHRLLGPDHPDTLETRSILANRLRMSGRVGAAARLLEGLLADRLRVLGPDHPDTLRTRQDLAFWLGRSGRIDEAVAHFESMLADGVRVLGADHPDTLTMRSDLASLLGEAGREDEAVSQFESLFADRVRVLGPDHPDTLRTRANVALWLSCSGRIDEAIASLSGLLADRLRVLGPDHPDTLDTRNCLAFELSEAGQVEESVAGFEGLLADQLRVLGPDHPDSLSTRYLLASVLFASGRVDEAVAGMEALVADQVRVLGPDHPDTLQTRSSAASLLGESGRVEDAVARLERVLADQVRVLGPDHPDTLLTCSSTASWLLMSGQEIEAVGRFERLFIDQVRVLGSDNPDTLTTGDILRGLKERSDNQDTTNE